LIETTITIKDEVYWLWVAYEPYTKKYLLMNISKDKTVFICYNFIKRLKKLYESIQYIQMELVTIIIKLVDG
jgi:transposase-like protein